MRADESMKTSAEVAGNRFLGFSFLSIGPEVKVTEMFFFFGVLTVTSMLSCHPPQMFFY